MSRFQTAFLLLPRSVDSGSPPGYERKAVKAKRDLGWARMLGELESFQETYGHVHVDLERKKHPALARWLQRVRGCLHALTYDQVLSLDNLGFFDRKDQRWLDRYAQLKGFKEKTSHCGVASRSLGNRPLARWVSAQRKDARKGLMAPWRRKLLTELEFCFQVVRTGVSVEWDEVIERLRGYRERFGHCNVPSTWHEDRQLVQWVSRLRGIKKSLDPKIIMRLDDVGFDWNPLRSRWEERFRQLEAFKARHGHCRVPRRPDGLNNWIGNLRHIKKTLSKARIRRLNALGFDWAPLDEAWAARYKELLAFKRRFGHTDVPARWAENRPLGIWVYGQRYRKETLSPEQVAMLDKTGFDWEPHESAWMQYYKELKAFRRRHGHCDPPVTKSALGGWVDHQRNKAKKIPIHRKKLLDQIGFNWDGKFNSAWMRHYEELKAYYTKYDNAPPHVQSPLGNGCPISERRTGREE